MRTKCLIGFYDIRTREIVFTGNCKICFCLLHTNTTIDQNIDEIIQKIENSILDLKIYLSKLEIFDKNQLEIPLPNRKSILHNRGPESGIYINSVKFDKEEDNFGLEEELSFKTHEYNNNDKSTVLPHFINSETHTSY